MLVKDNNMDLISLLIIIATIVFIGIFLFFYLREDKVEIKNITCSTTISDDIHDTDITIDIRSRNDVITNLSINTLYTYDGYSDEVENKYNEEKATVDDLITHKNIKGSVNLDEEAAIITSKITVDNVLANPNRIDSDYHLAKYFSKNTLLKEMVNELEELNYECK